MSTLIQITPASGITVGTTAVTSGTVGRVFFQGAGDVVQQDGDLLWDNTNKRLGVGVSIPAQRLHVAGSIRVGSITDNVFSNKFTALSNGEVELRANAGSNVVINATSGNNVGIGASTPQARLDVRAQGALSTDVAFRVRNSADTLNFAEFNGDGQFSLRKSNNERIGIGGAGGFLELSTNFSSLLFPLGAAGTEVTFNTSSQGLRVNSSTGRFYVNNTTYNGSLWMLRTVVGIGGLLSTNDLSSVSNSRGLTLLNGTPPTTNFEDRHWYYSADIVAGNAAPHFRTEAGDVIKLYKETTAVTAATFAANTSGIVDDTATFDGYTIGQVVKALRNLGILA
jgi:hypothetical protein